MSDRYDVTVSRTNESEDQAEVINIGQAYTVTLDEFGTLTIEAAGTIRSFRSGVAEHDGCTECRRNWR